MCCWRHVALFLELGYCSLCYNLGDKDRQGSTKVSHHASVRRKKSIEKCGSVGFLCF